MQNEKTVNPSKTYAQKILSIYRKNFGIHKIAAKNSSKI